MRWGWPSGRPMLLSADPPPHRMRVWPTDSARELFLIDGNSLVYRAFFALPETIATSRGQPTNAIFGFASMLVKLLTEYGQKPTIVAWDAGMSGRDEAYSEYKAGRRSRPDLLREQWPHMEPLVDAFGYANVKVPGYEADDVIATLAREARERGLEVMVVTGRPGHLPADRGRREGDGHGARHHGHEDLRQRGRGGPLRHPAGADPRLLRPEGRHLGQHPGRAGHRRQDRRAAAPAVRRPRDRAREHRPDLRAPSARRTSSTTPTTRACRSCWPPRSATCRSTSRTSTDRSCASPTARACARSFASSSCATRCGGSRRRSGARTRPRPRAEPSDAIAARARNVPPARPLLARGRAGRARRRASRAARGPAARHGRRGAAPLRRLRGRRGGAAGRGRLAGGGDRGMGIPRPVVAHDWKSIAAAEERCEAPPLEHDTEVAAYLVDPARRGYPLAELIEESGLGADGGGRHRPGRARRSDARAGGAPARRSSRSSISLRLLHEVELPLVDVLVEMERAGVKLDVETVRSIARARRRAGAGARARDLGAGGRGVHDRLAAAAGADPVREARPLEEAPRQDRVLHRRARAARDPRRAPDHAEDRDVARAHQAQVHLPRRLPFAARARRAAAHHLQPDRGHHRPAVEHRTPTCRTSRSAPSSGARSAPASRPRRATC